MNPTLRGGMFGMGALGMPLHGYQNGYGGDDMYYQENGKAAKETNKILIISKLPKGVTPDIIFRLFSLYGNVQKVKIMYKKRDTALVEYEDYLQANNARFFLNGCPLFGSNIDVNKSTCQTIKMSFSPAEYYGSTDESSLIKDYTHSNEHRYKVAWSKNFNNIAPTSDTLHISNLPANCTE